jgi:hypothetical protein
MYSTPRSVITTAALSTAAAVALAVGTWFLPTAAPTYDGPTRTVISEEGEQTILP